jgi:hypothetical protein
MEQNMGMVDKLPTMSDAALTALQENARRLEQRGTPPQRFAALALLPAIGAELMARRKARAAASGHGGEPGAKRPSRRKTSQPL